VSWLSTGIVKVTTLMYDTRVKMDVSSNGHILRERSARVGTSGFSRLRSTSQKTTRITSPTPTAAITEASGALPAEPTPMGSPRRIRPGPAGRPYSPLCSSTKGGGIRPCTAKTVYSTALVRSPAALSPLADSSRGVHAPVASTRASAYRRRPPAS